MALQVSGCRDFPTCSPLGSRGMIAAIAPRSSRGKPHETALSGLDERPFQVLSGNVELRYRLTVDLDRPLAAQASRLAGRGDPEAVDQQRRQMDRISGRQRSLLDVGRGFVLTNDAGQMFRRSESRRL